ncbi:hypothetical protein EVAR_30840_1 [Eumeta japonica]|uniref:Uncharacterized protein n=1 Tax=Eumeta variegata TaxID=151549 RepID=A0A4C1XS14_EUMVA|nr:hypothetical protein EVAR_30840_1 [Eumeta japonica]
MSADLRSENVENNSRNDNNSSFFMGKNTPTKEVPLAIENISALLDQKLASTCQSSLRLQCASDGSVSKECPRWRVTRRVRAALVRLVLISLSISPFLNPNSHLDVGSGPVPGSYPGPAPLYDAAPISIPVQFSVLFLVTNR